MILWNVMRTLSVILFAGYEVGTKFDDCGTNFDEFGTKYKPEVIK